MDVIVLSIGDIDINLTQLLTSFLTIVFGFIVYKILVVVVKRKKILIQMSDKFKRFILLIVGFLILLLSFVVILHILHIQVKQLFNKELISGDNFHITVFGLMSVILVVFIVRLVVFIVEHSLNARINSGKIDRGRGRSLFQIIKYLLWLLGFALALNFLGFEVTFLIASISALLIGVGFGLQHIFNDIFSGIIILFDGSIEVDDVVEVEGFVGRVKEIGLRVSKVVSRDNVDIIVPNSKFTGEKVINWSHNDEVTRFHVNIGVAYGSDVRLVEKILLKIAMDHKDIVDKPEPFVRFNDFGDSSLNFQLFFWTMRNFMVENIKSDIRFEIDLLFRENKVQIPFPQRDIHLKSKDFS